MGGSEQSERVYDPTWTNTLTLLDFLATAQLLQTDLANAGIGQFVKASGSLKIHDLATVKSIWDIPLVQRQIFPKRNSARVGKNREERRKKEAQREPQHAQTNPMELGLEIIKVLPHVITAKIESACGTRVWSSLREDGLTGSSSDLFLKHGSSIAGDWSLVGIMDAAPDPGGLPAADPDEALKGFGTDGFGFLLDILGNSARSFLGRPSDAYGVTPIVIYRVVAG